MEIELIIVINSYFLFQKEIWMCKFWIKIYDIFNFIKTYILQILFYNLLYL